MPIHEEKIKETIIWLSGLLSTDGSILRHKNSLSFVVVSSEKNWLELIRERLEEIDINASLRREKMYGFKEHILYSLYIKEPFKIYKLLKKYALSYLSPRKKNILLNAYIGAPNRKWTAEENNILEHLYETNSTKLKAVTQAMKVLKRSKSAIYHQYQKMGGLE